MKEISRSPEHGRFGIKKLNEKLEEGITTKEHVAEMTELYESMINQKHVEESSPEFKENNLEYDLRSTDWILEKVRNNEAYAQNLYAALCNNDFQKLDVIPILKDEKWSCSWRYAGGIIADMRQEGDYIDWYCSGIRDRDDNEEENKKWDGRGYVAESVVTEEIEKDLKQLGWIVNTEE